MCSRFPSVVVFILLAANNVAAWLCSQPGHFLSERSRLESLQHQVEVTRYGSGGRSMTGMPGPCPFVPVGRLASRSRLSVPVLCTGGGFGGGGRDSGGHNGGDGWNRGDRREEPIPGAFVAFWPRGAPEGEEVDFTSGPQKSFSADQIPDVWDSKPIRCAVVTGANTGIGLEMATQLASKGWHVVMACRNKKRGQIALERVRAAVGPKARVELMELDAGDPESVRNFAMQLRSQKKGLHLLINNAGVMLNDFKICAWGVEQTFGVNYLGPFLLTSLLLPPLRQATSKDFPSRIVNVGSEALRFAPNGGIVFNVSTINDPDLYETGHRNDADFRQDGGQVDVNEDIYVNCCHPGLIKSDLFREAGECFPPFFGWVGRRMSTLAEAWRRDVANGALTPLFLATSPSVVRTRLRGEYVVPCEGLLLPSWLAWVTNAMLAPLGVYLPPGLRLEPWSTGNVVDPVVADEPAEANDFQLAGQLWEFSKALSDGGADVMEGKPFAGGEIARLGGYAVTAATMGWTAKAMLEPTDAAGAKDDDRLVDIKLPVVGQMFKVQKDEDESSSSESDSDDSPMNMDKLSGGF